MSTSPFRHMFLSSLSFFICHCRLYSAYVHVASITFSIFTICSCRLLFFASVSVVSISFFICFCRLYYFVHMFMNPLTLLFFQYIHVACIILFHIFLLSLLLFFICLCRLYFYFFHMFMSPFFLLFFICSCPFYYFFLMFL